PAGASGDLGGADHIDVEWQMRAVLLDGATRENADFAKFDGVVDLGPGEFFIPKLFERTAGHCNYLNG
ncbi:MAG TPA: hypothetical protein VHS97_17375, partial [Isosphaeraceae bacterium]|nr:hypothetical protein [Isosphaeraceae bacterium]